MYFMSFVSSSVVFVMDFYLISLWYSAPHPLWPNRKTFLLFVMQMSGQQQQYLYRPPNNSCSYSCCCWYFLFIIDVFFFLIFLIEILWQYVASAYSSYRGKPTAQAVNFQNWPEEKCGKKKMKKKMREKTFAFKKIFLFWLKRFMSGNKNITKS